MASLSNYTDLQAAVGDYLNRADLTTQVPAYFITLAEAMLNKAVRSRLMVAQTTVSIAAAATSAALPADCLELLYTPLDHVSADRIADLRRFRFLRPGNARYLAISGGQIEVCPAPAAALSLLVSYYQRIPALSPTNPSNWLLAESPELYLYASLLHAQTLLKDEDRVQIMGTVTVQLLTSALGQNARVVIEPGETPTLSFAPPSS